MIRLRQTQLTSRMLLLSRPEREGAMLSTLTDEIVRSSEIEQGKCDSYEVRSLHAWRLGVDANGSPPADRAIEGAVEMMLDATQHFKGKLTSERLFGWHASLSPPGARAWRKSQLGMARHRREG
nr:DUF4172 domain-containing protein [Bradyrhizobium sp. 199]